MFGYEVFGSMMLMIALLYMVGVAFLSLILLYFCMLLKVKITYLKALSATLITSLGFIVVSPFLYLIFYSTTISLIISYLIALLFFFIIIKTTWQKTIILYLLSTATASLMIYAFLYIINGLNS